MSLEYLEYLVIHITSHYSFSVQIKTIFSKKIFKSVEIFLTILSPLSDSCKDNIKYCKNFQISKTIKKGELTNIF